MRNPGRSEPDAFRFLLLVILAAAPVTLAASLGPAWLALTVLAVVLGVTALNMLRPSPKELRLKTAPGHVGAAEDRRILVVANDTLGDDGLARELERLASSPSTHVRVLAPALVSRRARVTSDVDRAREQAQRRLDEALDRVGRDQLSGEVSVADPLQAIEDALVTFPADEIVVSTRSERPWEGLEPRLASLARERFALPVEQLVFEPDTRAEILT